MLFEQSGDKVRVLYNERMKYIFVFKPDKLRGFFNEINDPVVTWLRRGRHQQARPDSKFKMNSLICLAVSISFFTKNHGEISRVPLNPTSNCRRITEIDREMSKRQVRFSLEAYKASASVKEGFFAVPTIDVYAILSQMLYGAEGLSLQQLTNVLHFSPDCPIARIGLERILHRMNRLRGYKASMNSKIFHAYESGLEKTFLRNVNKYLHSEPQQVASWEEITNGNAIYAWTKNVGITYPYKHTFEGDKSLVLASAAEFMTDLFVLVYNGYRFNSEFIYNDEKKIECGFIQVTAELNSGEIIYHRNSNGDDAIAQYVEFTWPRKDEENIKTIIILPYENKTITELESNIDEVMLHEILSNDVTHLVNLTVPRYIMLESAYDLTEVLVNMNLTEMFKETNDFRKIIRKHPTKVGPVFQQTGTYLEWIHKYAPGIDPKIEPDFDPRFENAAVIEVDRACIILNAYKGENPLILSMGRYGWIPGVTDAEEGMFAFL